MITSFTVDRATWLHGEGSNKSYLRRVEDGKMCCLGFMALACGLPEASILGEKVLWRMHEDKYAMIPKALRDQAEPMNRLMALNDVPLTEDIQVLLGGDLPLPDVFNTEADRERWLTGEFQSVGIEVTFTGEYPSPV